LRYLENEETIIDRITEAVIDARRAIEPNVCMIAVERVTDHDIRRLAKHVEAEQAAHKAGDRRSATRLSGLFHAKLAEISNNPTLERIVMGMVIRTSLIIGMFGAAGTTILPFDGHAKLLGAIKNKQHRAAAKQMIVHLDHIEEQVNLLFNRETSINLIEVFGQKTGVVENLGFPA